MYDLPILSRSAPGGATLNHAEAIIALALEDGKDDDIVLGLGRVLARVMAGGTTDSAALAAAAVEHQLGDRLPQVLAGFKERISQSSHLTAGAKSLVSTESRLEPAFRVVVADKLARSVLRGDHAINLKRVLSAGGEPLLTGPRRTTRAEADPSIDATLEALTGSTFGEFCSTNQVRFALLDHEEPRIGYRAKGGNRTTSLPEIVRMLDDESQQGTINAICAALVADDDHRLLLLVLRAAWQAGHIRVHPRHGGQLRVFCIRALLLLHASETAYREATALAEDWEALSGVPKGELRRFDGLLARAAARSGRTGVATRQYTDLYSRNAADAACFRELLACVSPRDEPLTRALCEVALEGSLSLGRDDQLFVTEVLRRLGETSRAGALLQRLQGASPMYADAHVGRANVGVALANDVVWRSSMERYFEAQGVPVVHAGDQHERPWAFVSPDLYQDGTHPSVTIVMTAFDASATLAQSVHSVQQQTCANWELVIIDDHSGDGTRALIERLAGQDDRIRPIFKPANEGTYVARNEGIRAANGEFVTFLDSDDWMHPLRLERHLEAMRDGAACSISSWIRMDRRGLAAIRRNGRFTHPNHSSTFLRTDALDTVGYFDGVRAGADAEFVARLRATLGAASIRMIDICLGIGLHHDTSLTQSGPTAFDEDHFSAVRLAYTESWLRWHVACIADRRSLYDGAMPDGRYPVPPEMRP